MAWLNAAPKPPEGSKRASGKFGVSSLSRAEQIRKTGGTAKMPPNPAPHILERFVEMGISEAAGMGAAPLSWREIMAWQAATGVRLAPWEARLIRRLSTEYLAESRRAESETCPPPWRAGLTAQDHAAERAALDMVLG